MDPPWGSRERHWALEDKRAVDQLGCEDAATFGEEMKLWVLRGVAIWVQLPSTAPEMTESQMPGGCVVPMECCDLGDTGGCPWWVGTRNVQGRPHSLMQPQCLTPGGNPVRGCRMTVARVALAGGPDLVNFSLREETGELKKSTIRYFNVGEWWLGARFKLI